MKQIIKDCVTLKTLKDTKKFINNIEKFEEFRMKHLLGNPLVLALITVELEDLEEKIGKKIDTREMIIESEVKKVWTETLDWFDQSWI